MGQGRDNVKIYLKENPAFAADIERQVRENADKLLPGAARRALAAKPKAVDEAPEDAPEDARDEEDLDEKPARSGGGNIDIAVDDEA